MKHDVVVICSHRFVRHELFCSMCPSVRVRKELKFGPKVHTSENKHSYNYTQKPVLNIYMKGVVMHSELVIKLTEMVKYSRHDN